MGLSDEELQASGYGSPPYHPYCRGMLSLIDETPGSVDDGGVSALVDQLLGGGAEDAELADEDLQTPANLDLDLQTPATGWDADDIQALEWAKFDVTDPATFKDVSDAIDMGDYDTAQDLIDKWKSDQMLFAVPSGATL